MPRGGRKQEDLVEPQTRMFLGSDGQWHAFIPVGLKANGSADRRHRQAPTQEELTKKVLEVEQTVERGDIVLAARSPKFIDWLNEWVTDIAPIKARYSTVERYKVDIRNYLGPNLGQWRLTELRHHHFANLYKKLHADGLSPSTIHKVHRAACAALNKAVLFGSARTNPVPAAADALPDIDVDAVEPLDTHEVQAIAKELGTRRNGVRWLLAMLGPRQGEVLGLKWSDVNWDTGIIKIQRKLQKRTYEHGCADPRACAARRCIPAGGCPLNCSLRRWEHGCLDARVCAAKKCNRPLYPSDVKRGVTVEPCPTGCTGHERTCPERRRSACSREAHRQPCPVDCTGHARHCPERKGGLLLEEPEESAETEARPGRRKGQRKSKRDLRPKSKAGERRLPLPAFLMDELREHRRAQETERALAGSKWMGLDLIFATPFGAPIHPFTDWEEWGEILDAAGVEYIHPHGARHSAATFLGAEGIDPLVVMAILGWSSPDMAKRYRHIPDAILQAAGNQLGTAMFGDFATGAATGPSDGS
jgi:integrase